MKTKRGVSRGLTMGLIGYWFYFIELEELVFYM